MTRFRTTSVFRRCGIAAAVLLALAFAPGRAEASCGDHVLILNQTTARQPKADRVPADYPVPPCHGPNCSGGPDREVPPLSTSAAPDWGKELPKPVAQTRAEPDARRSLELEADITYPVRRATSIFHPPRLG